MEDYEDLSQQDQGPLKSKYNSAVAQIMRLDNLWQMANYHALQGNLNKWNWVLDTLWRELASDALPDHLKLILKLNERIIEAKINRNRFYQMLQAKDIILRRIQNQQGKGSVYSDPNEDLLED